MNLESVITLATVLSFLAVIPVHANPSYVKKER